MTVPIPIDRHRQLFLDGRLIEWRDKMTRRVCPIVKCAQNPVIRPEGDLEPSGYITYGSVLYDGEEGVYKAWCQGEGAPLLLKGSADLIRGGLYYFTSPDGVRWDRPALDALVVQGRRTNIVSLPCHSQHEKAWPGCYEYFGVSRDLRESNPQRRYKLGFLHLTRDYHGPGEDPFHPAQRRGLGVAFSPDGVHWTPVQDPVTRATCDGTTFWYQDETSGRFVLYGRTKHVAADVRARYGEELAFQRHHWGRAVRRAESADFVHWTPDEGQFTLSTDALDAPGDEIYGMSVFHYEGIYVGLVQMFYKSEERLHLDLQLAVGRDGVSFQRLSDRRPFIPVGEVSEWDRFNTSPANNPPLRVGDELRFYYGGRNVRHSAPYQFADDGKGAGLRYTAAVGFGTVKLDRFAAMEATFDPGRLQTKPILFEGGRLHVNAAVPFGRLDVALLDADGVPLPGLQAGVQECDAIDLVVPMDRFAELARRPVRLEFALRNGKLFSFWVD